jgi:hypothetical protein
VEQHVTLNTAWNAAYTPVAGLIIAVDDENRDVAD